MIILKAFALIIGIISNGINIAKNVKGTGAKNKKADKNK
jgi:hypothetical protein